MDELLLECEQFLGCNQNKKPFCRDLVDVWVAEISTASFISLYISISPVISFYIIIARIIPLVFCNKPEKALT